MELLNNLNFDVEKHFGLGVSAFTVKIQQIWTVPNSSLPALLFDASGIVYEVAGRDRNYTSLNGTNPFFTVENSIGSGASAMLALTNTTRCSPIQIQGIIYEVIQTGSGVDSLKQFNDATFTVLRGSIDGQLIQGQDIQPNYLKRNWLYQQDNFIVMKGDLEIDQNTGIALDVFGDAIVELTFLVKGFN